MRKFLELHKKAVFIAFALLFLLFDIQYSVVQYTKAPIDGDFANIVLPDENYKQVLKDPMGINMLVNQEKHPATNRFTAHFVMKSYFDNVPFWFQKIVSPIDSLYASITLAKLFIHLGFLSILGFYLASFIGFSWKKFTLFLVLISPFLIVSGQYRGNIGFIDTAVTYSFFYTLPLIPLLLLYFPIYKTILTNKALKYPLLYASFGIPTLFLLVFFGPLSAPLILLLNTFILLYFLIENKKNHLQLNWFSLVVLTLRNFNRAILLIVFLGSILSLYSLYVGSFNSENNFCELTISERYQALPIGMLQTFLSIDLGALLWVLFIGVNLYIIHKQKVVGAPIILKLSFYFLLFALCYCLLLPLGGCRTYRPFILRSDTFVPLLVGLLFLLILTSYVVLNHLKNKAFKIYLFFFAFCSLYFMFSDTLPRDTNANEKKALHYLATKAAQGKENITLPIDCTVLSWTLISEYEQSKNASYLLYKLNILKRPTVFKNKMP